MTQAAVRAALARTPAVAALLLTYSPGHKRALWTQWRSAAQGGVLRVELGPLSASEVAALAPGAPRDWTDGVHRLTGEPTLPRRERASLAGRLGRLALGSLAYGETMALLCDIVADDLLSDGVRGELRLHLGLLLGNQAGDGDAQRAQLRIAIRELRRRPLLVPERRQELHRGPHGDRQ